MAEHYTDYVLSETAPETINFSIDWTKGLQKINPHLIPYTKYRPPLNWRLHKEKKLNCSDDSNF